jgi:hypothetical protein
LHRIREKDDRRFQALGAVHVMIADLAADILIEIRAYLDAAAAQATAESCSDGAWLRS